MCSARISSMPKMTEATLEKSSALPLVRYCVRPSPPVMPEETSQSRISLAAHSEALTSLTSLPRYALIASPTIP